MGKRTQIRKTSLGSNSKLKPGSILCDTAKNRWILGKPIGAGGFGDIYLVSKDVTRPVPSDTTYVAKVELLTNGPLFVEMNFYLRVGKEDLIQKWKEERSLKHLGMPRYAAFGSHTSGSERYRFIILERYGSDIASLFIKNGRCFALKTVLTLGLQILDILEYIHYHGYIHADIKGSNLLLGFGKKNENKVFLLDFGLACLYIDRYGRHKEFNHDLRRAHDGTLEYTSRDAHVGAHSRRGDLEVLGYNLVQWLCGELPWEKDLPDPDQVAASKNLYMSNTSHLMDKCFPRGGAPVVIHQYLRYVAGLGFTAKPDYDRLRSMLRQGMRAASLEDNGLLNLGCIVNKKISKKRGHGSDTENTRNGKRLKLQPKSLRRPCVPVQASSRKTRQKSMVGRTAGLRSQEFDWVKVLQSHPERDARPLAKANKPRPVVERAVEDVAENLRRKPENPRINPTPAMLNILGKQKESLPPAKRSARTDSHRRSPSPCDAAHLTPAMEEVLHKKRCPNPVSREPQTTAMTARALRQRKPTSYVEQLDSEDDSKYDTDYVKPTTFPKKAKSSKCVSGNTRARTVNDQNGDSLQPDMPLLRSKSSRIKNPPSRFSLMIPLESPDISEEECIVKRTRSSKVLRCDQSQSLALPTALTPPCSEVEQCSDKLSPEVPPNNNDKDEYKSTGCSDLKITLKRTRSCRSLRSNKKFKSSPSAKRRRTKSCSRVAKYDESSENESFDSELENFKAEEFYTIKTLRSSRSRCNDQQPAKPITRQRTRSCSGNTKSPTKLSKSSDDDSFQSDVEESTDEWLPNKDVVRNSRSRSKDQQIKLSAKPLVRTRSRSQVNKSPAKLLKSLDENTIDSDVGKNKTDECLAIEDIGRSSRSRCNDPEMKSAKPLVRHRTRSRSQVNKSSANFLKSPDEDTIDSDVGKLKDDECLPVVAIVNSMRTLRSNEKTRLSAKSLVRRRTRSLSPVNKSPEKLLKSSDEDTVDSDVGKNKADKRLPIGAIVSSLTSLTSNEETTPPEKPHRTRSDFRITKSAAKSSNEDASDSDLDKYTIAECLPIGSILKSSSASSLSTEPLVRPTTRSCSKTKHSAATEATSNSKDDGLRRSERRIEKKEICDSRVLVKNPTSSKIVKISSSEVRESPCSLTMAEEVDNDVDDNSSESSSRTMLPNRKTRSMDKKVDVADDLSNESSSKTMLPNRKTGSLDGIVNAVDDNSNESSSRTILPNRKNWTVNDEVGVADENSNESSSRTMLLSRKTRSMDGKVDDANNNGNEPSSKTMLPNRKTRFMDGKVDDANNNSNEPSSKTMLPNRKTRFMDENVDDNSNESSSRRMLLNRKTRCMDEKVNEADDTSNESSSITMLPNRKTSLMNGKVDDADIKSNESSSKPMLLNRKTRSFDEIVDDDAGDNINESSSRLMLPDRRTRSMDEDDVDNSSEESSKYVSLTYRPPTPPMKSTNKHMFTFREEMRPNFIMSRHAFCLRRCNRREVSPSEVNFLPKLRSGRDPILDYENACNACRTEKLQKRPSSTPPFGSSLFNSSQRKSLFEMFTL